MKDTVCTSLAWGFLLVLVACTTQVGSTSMDMSVPAECRNDGDCSIGHKCSVGLCVPIPAEPKDMDVLRPGECRTSNDCRNQLLCSTKSNRCVTCYGSGSPLYCEEHLDDYLDSILIGVWGSSANDVWAVGQKNRYQSLIMHWDGKSWAYVDHPEQGPLNHIYGTAPKDIWAVGEKGAVLHYQNGTWDSVAHGRTTLGLKGVWATADHVWAVGALGTVLHLDRGTGVWKMENPTSQTLNTIHGVGDVMWVGGYGGTLLRYEAGWRPTTTTLTPDHSVSGIFASSSTLVWASAFGVNTLKDTGFALKGDGTTFTVLRTQPTNMLFGVWASDPTHVWFVGDGAILRYDAVAWDTVGRNTGRFAGARLYGAWGSGPQDVWTTGGFLIYDLAFWWHAAILHHPL